MRWSWRIGRVAGIDVYLHVTFLLVLGWLVVQYYLPRRSWVDLGLGTIFIVALFAIVVLHELGHALTARRFGIRTRDITLLPIGGIARLERMPDKPWQELLVALAGPAVNAALAIALLPFLVFEVARQALEPGREINMVGGGLLVNLFLANVLLAVFNLLPAFPMDGGRVLRALLAMRIDYVQATRIAAGIGQGMALLFGFIGLFTNPVLVFIALFVWMGAAAEASMVQVRAALGGIPVSRAMITDFRTLAPDDALQRGVEHILSGFQQDFPVVQDNEVVGVLTRDDLVRALAGQGAAMTVREAMKSSFATAEAEEMLEGALQRLQGAACRALPVLSAGRLVGILTVENVGELLMVQRAVRRAGGSPAVRPVGSSASPGRGDLSP